MAATKQTHTKRSFIKAIVITLLGKKLLWRILSSRKHSTKGTAVLVTGTSSGIGKDIVNFLASKGVRCYAGVRKEEDYQKWLDKANVMPVYLDISDKTQIDDAVGAVNLDMKQNNVDLVGIVNNAGIGIVGPLECLSASELRRQFEINVFGSVQVSNAFMPLLRNSKFYKRSRIVYVTSVAGVIPGLGLLTAYCMSKHAMEALVDGQRVEFAAMGCPTKVIAIEPGCIKSSIVNTDLEVLKRNVDACSSELKEIYKDLINKVGPLLEGSMKYSSQPKVVSQQVARALFSKLPKARYLAGWDAHMVPLLKIVPNSMLEFLAVLSIKKVKVDPSKVILQ